MPGDHSMWSSSIGCPKPIDVAHDDGLVVRRVVGEFADADVVDALAERRQNQRQNIVGEPGIDPVDVQARTAVASGLDDVVDHRVGKRLPWVKQNHRARRHDVDALTQEPRQVRDGLDHTVVGHGGVQDAVGFESHQFVPIGGGRDAELATETSKFAGVLAGLVSRRRPDADQFEIRMSVDTGDGVPPDGSGGPNDDAQRALWDYLRHDAETRTSSTFAPVLRQRHARGCANLYAARKRSLLTCV